MLFSGESNVFFFLSCFPDTKQLIELLLKSKQLFTKRLIVQFTILVAIIGNKSSKYFFVITYIKLLSNFKI